MFPNIQPEPSLAQIEVIATSYLGEDADTHLATTSFLITVEWDEVSPEFLFSRLQSQFPQPLPLRLVFQIPHSFIALLWTRSRASVSFLQWGAHNWTQYLRCRLTSAEHRGTITSLLLLAILFLLICTSNFLLPTHHFSNAGQIRCTFL